MIEVHVNHADRIGVSAAAIERAVKLVLGGDAITEAEISVTLLPDDEIRRLNRSYLSHDWPTDVLAFGLGSDETRGSGDGALLGDIYIGADRAVAQAKERGIERLEEAVRLAVHGTLHLLGRDHPDGPDRERSAFFVEQEAWVARALGPEGAG